MPNNHTPGPWQIARASEETYHVDIETVERGKDLPNQGFHLATAYWHPGSDGLDNARLMAAAPELLAVVRDMLSGLAYLRQQGISVLGFGIDRLEETGTVAIEKVDHVRFIKLKRREL